MELKQLKVLINKYDSTTYARKYYYGDHERAVILKRFMSQFEQNKDDYSLNSHQEFQLAKLLCTMDYEIPLISSFRKLFNFEESFFPLFICLDSNNLIDETNFSKIHDLSSVHMESIQSIFGRAQFSKHNLDAGVLKKLLSVMINKSYAISSIETCFMLISEKKLLNDCMVSLVEKNILLLEILSNVLESLKQFGLLNIESIKLMENCGSLLNVKKLLVLIKKTEIKLDMEILKLILEYPSLVRLEEFLSITINSKQLKIDSLGLKSILSVHWEYNHIHILKLLVKNNALDQETSQKLHCKEVVIMESLTLLDQNNLFNKANFNAIIDLKKNRYDFNSSINNLLKRNLLNNDTLTLMLSEKVRALNIFLRKIPENIKLDYHILEQLGSRSQSDISDSCVLSEIIEVVSKKQLLHNEQFQQLLKLAPSYYKKLLDLIVNLEKNKQLNADTFKQLFAILTNKQPKPEEASFIVKQQGGGDSLWLQYQLKQGEFQCYVKQDPNKSHLSGGFGIVMQASKSVDDDTTAYLIKTLKCYNQEKNLNKEAMRETKYTRLLGRESHFFQQNKQWHIISDWQTGQTLAEVPSSDLTALSFKSRLQSIIYLLNELSTLHKQFRVHGDIKPVNCVFDNQLMQLKLIDLGSARKVKLRNYEIPFSPAYLDKTIFRMGITNQYNFCDDMYALGLVAASMFPEIYTLTFIGNSYEALLNKEALLLSLEETSIYHLMSSMLNAKREARCTSSSALAYCESIHSLFDNISETNLGDILVKTLHKAECNFDDIVHDCSVASMAI